MRKVDSVVILGLALGAAGLQTLGELGWSRAFLIALVCWEFAMLRQRGK